MSPKQGLPFEIPGSALSATGWVTTEVWHPCRHLSGVTEAARVDDPNTRVASIHRENRKMLI